jgi:hypothetical protein
VYPKDRLAVIVLTNGQATGPEQLADRIAQRYFAQSQIEKAAGE